MTDAGTSRNLVVQAWTAQQLQQDLGFAPEQAQQLSEWSHGRDKAPVAERPPPKTLSIQMTLTPIPLVMHPSMGRDIAVAGGKAGMTKSTFVVAVSRCFLSGYKLEHFLHVHPKLGRISRNLLICLQQCLHCVICRCHALNVSCDMLDVEVCFGVSLLN